LGIDGAVIAEDTIHFPGAGAKVTASGAETGGAEVVEDVDAGALASDAFTVVIPAHGAMEFAEAIANRARRPMSAAGSNLLQHGVVFGSILLEERIPGGLRRLGRACAVLGRVLGGELDLAAVLSLRRENAHPLLGSTVRDRVEGLRQRRRGSALDRQGIGIGGRVLPFESDDGGEVDGDGSEDANESVHRPGIICNKRREHSWLSRRRLRDAGELWYRS